MPQEIRVVKCFQCRVYQTDIVKKAKKWQCKLCGEKQSLLQEFCKGTGKMCREYAQKLNAKHASQEEQLVEQAIILEEQINELNTSNLNDVENNSIEPDTDDPIPSKMPKLQSKWSDYLENTEASDEENNIFN